MQPAPSSIVEPVAVAQKKTYTLDDIAALAFHSPDTKISSNVDATVYGV